MRVGRVISVRRDKRNGEERHLPEGCLPFCKCNDVVRPVRRLQDPQGHNVGPGLEEAHGNLLIWTFNLSLNSYCVFLPVVCPWRWWAIRWHRRWCRPPGCRTGTHKTPPQLCQAQGEDQTRHWNMDIRFAFADYGGFLQWRYIFTFFKDSYFPFVHVGFSHPFSY